MQAQSTVVYEQAYTITKLSAPVAGWCNASIPDKHFRHRNWKVEADGRTLYGCDECMSLWMRNQGLGERLPTSRECASEIPKKSARPSTPTQPRTSQKPRQKQSDELQPIHEVILKHLQRPLLFGELRDRVGMDRFKLRWLMAELRDRNLIEMKLIRRGRSIYVISEKSHLLDDYCSPAREVSLTSSDQDKILARLDEPQITWWLAQDMDKPLEWVARRIITMKASGRVATKRLSRNNTAVVRAENAHLLEGLRLSDFPAEQVKQSDCPPVTIDLIVEILGCDRPMRCCEIADALNAPREPKTLRNIHSLLTVMRKRGRAFKTKVNGRFYYALKEELLQDFNPDISSFGFGKKVSDFLKKHGPLSQQAIAKRTYTGYGEVKKHAAKVSETLSILASCGIVYSQPSLYRASAAIALHGVTPDGIPNIDPLEKIAIEIVEEASRIRQADAMRKLERSPLLKGLEVSDKSVKKVFQKLRKEGAIAQEKIGSDIILYPKECHESRGSEPS